MRIPKDLQWQQNNLGTRLGNLYSSQNIDLTDNIGNLRVSPRLLSVTTSSDDADLGIPVAFKYYIDKWWTISGAVLFKQASPDGSASYPFTQDATASTPTDCSTDISDMELFGGLLYVTRASADVSYYNGSAWNSFTVTSSGSADTKLLCRYGDRLYMTYGSGSYRVTSWDTSRVLGTMGSSYTLTLSGSQLRITFLRASSTGIWVGTMNVNNGKGSIFFWDGQQSTPNYEYPLNSIGVTAGFVDNDILYAIDVDGALLQFNGGGFTKVDRLPIPKDTYLFSPIDEDNADRFVHPNGMTARDGVIRVLVNGRVFNSSQSTLETLPSGIWEWTSKTGFYHKYSPSYTGSGTTTITDYGQTRISKVGALVDAKSVGQNVSKGTLLAGIQYYSDATTTKQGIFIDDNTETVQKYGEIILPEIVSGHFTDMWQKIVPRFRKLLDSGDYIVVKHRVDKETPTQINITWASTTTFTTTSSLTIGDEIKILNGTGGGKSAHITDITGSGTFTVTVDETFTGATGTAIAHVNSWIKDGKYTAQTDNFTEFTVSEPSTVIQVKICFQITGEWDLYDLIIENSADKQTK